MSSNPDDDGPNHNNKPNNDNKNSVRPKKLANDNSSLKSETSSISRPLKFGTNEESNKSNEDQLNNNFNNEESIAQETDISKTSRFATLGQCTNESQDEKTPCCANLAINLYNKALESAKRALPKTKTRPQFPRSFGEDFESIGPEGFHYLDDGQTECSYDYKDIEFRRDLIFRPEIEATNDGIPIVLPEDSEPMDFNAMRDRYGLPENADRVQKYDPKSAQKLEIIPVISTAKTIELKKESKEIPDKKNPETPKRNEKMDLKSDNSNENKTPDSDEKPAKLKVSVIESAVVLRNKNEAKILRPPEIQIEICDNESVGTPAVDLLAKRTSQLIVEDAIEAALKLKNSPSADPKANESKNKKVSEKDTKKSSIESAKELKKQKKELEKQLKEEEKKAKKVEKLNKELDKKDKKQLFSRFKTEDKQKKQIMKKQKEFEKLKKNREKEREKKKKLSDGNQIDVREEVVEQNEVYEKSFSRFDNRPYEDIDKNLDEINQKNSDLKINNSPEIPSVKIDSPTAEDVVRLEYIENIQEIGVTYIPPDDGIDNESFADDEIDESPQKISSVRKMKSRVSSFKLLKMNVLKTKVKEIFPKKQQKSEKTSEIQNEIIVKDTKSEESPQEIQCTTELKNEKKIILDSNVDKSPAPAMTFEGYSRDGQRSDVKIDHEYENVVETEVKAQDIPQFVSEEAVINEFLTDDDEKGIKDRILISAQNNKNNKKKKSKTKAKLDRFKAKAFESLPKISSIKTKVKDLLPKREIDPNYRKDLEYERFISDQESFNQRMKYFESDGEAVSDSELCDSLHRTSGFGRQHVYEEMAATQERLDAYMTPISGPLRPPRRFLSFKNGQKVASVPALATQVLLKPKRVPPPRPPPPRPAAPKIMPTIQIVVEPNADQRSEQIFERNDFQNKENSLKRKTKQKVPANIYYNNIRLGYKPKRRFVNLRSSYQLLVYDMPKSPIAVKNGKNQLKSLTNIRIFERNERNLELKYNTMPQMDIKSIADHNFQSDIESNYPKYEDIEFRSRAPRPPPRRRRKTARSQTMDALYWRPFTWKSRRCRSMTELDVRQKPKIEVKPNYENLASVRPPRPPPPSGSKLSLKNKLTDISQLYASVHKGSHKIDVSKRPLPPPPVPPRPKCISVSTNSTSVGSLTPVTTRSESPSPATRDVSVSTKDNGLIQVCEKETQSDNDFQCGHDLNGNLEPETPTTPTTPTPTNSFAEPSPEIKEFIQKSIAEQTGELSESTVTLSSVTTTNSNWFDAEDPNDWDENTINEDIESIASNYQSLSSEATITSSKYMSAASEEKSNQSIGHKSGKRSQSIKHRPQESPPRPPRRSLPENRMRKTPSNEEEDEDTDELLGLTKDLQSELKQILDRRSKLPQRPDSTNSSNASLHEPIDSSSDGDDYSLTSANEQSPEFFKRKQQQKLFFIAKELYSSEEVFVDVLHLLNCDFRSAVAIHLPEEVLNSILQLLPQLQQINEQLLSELKSRIDNWANNQRISDVLVKICPFLKQYSIYIRDFEEISANYDEAIRRYPSFAAAVKEFESTPRCQKLSVKHFMLKPVQRLPQYRLLLQDYLRHLNDKSDDYLDTINALNIVSQVAEHANNTMKFGDNVSKLLSIQNSIIGRNEIIKPGRMFIKEGELMKLSRKGMQERCFILFNDSLMYLTPVQNGVYRVNHELSLTGMRVSLPSQQDFQNEFSVISHTRSFSLAARSPHEREEWVTALNKAIQENANKRISFAKSRSQTDDPSSTLQLGNCAPVWIPDARVTMCQLCTSEFSVTFRRHHCRCCGKVVCSACSANKAPLPYLKNRSARVCDECFNKLKQELEQIEKQVAECGASSGEVNVSASESDEGWSLNAWRQQFVRSLPRSSNRKAKARYVPSVLKEVCANDEGSLISGYLHRRESKRNWKRYWFVIKDLVLYTYKASEDVAALKSLPLLGFKVESLKDSVDGIDPKSLFQLSHPGQPSIIFRAETIGSAERWFKAMQIATTLE